MVEQFRAALRAKEAAPYLGIGQSTLWKLAKQYPNLIRQHKLGTRATVFLKSDLDAFLAQHAKVEV